MISIPPDDQETLIDAGFHQSPYHGDCMFSRFSRNHSVYECVTLEEPFTSNPPCDLDPAQPRALYDLPRIQRWR